MTEHRRCEKPLEGGKDCQGEAILVKECNTDPCEEEDPEEKEPDLPLKVKIMKVSERP